MLKQTDKGMLTDIQQVGCFFRCSVAMAEITTRINLTADENNSLWKRANKQGYIKDRSMINGACPIANLAFELLHVKYKTHLFRCYEVGTMKNGQATFYSGIREDFKKPDFVIKKINTGKPAPYQNHFILKPFLDFYYWDPHEPPIKEVSEAYQIMFKIVNLSVD